MTDKKRASELAAELAEAVRELPDDEVAAELRALRAEVEKLAAKRDCHTCCHPHCSLGHCNCSGWHYINTTVMPTITQPFYTSISSGTSTVYTVT